MHVTLDPGRSDDAPAIAALRNLVAAHLTDRYGKGPWSVTASARGVLLDHRGTTVCVARCRSRVIASLNLGVRRPWAIDASYFTQCDRPLYLTNMTVHPEWQGRGIGRRCLAHASVIARRWPADAIRLDAFDAKAGAGAFYLKCGYRQVGRASYRNTPLVYFELVL